MPSATRWRLVFLIATALFIGLGFAVFAAGVFPLERALYEWVHRVVPAAAIPASFTVTKLGSERFVFLAALVILALLPARFLARWWLWIAVVLGAAWLEGVAKDIIGRPRPVSFRPGFPSGHTTTAAAFYFLLAYLAGRIFPGRRWHATAWVLAVLTVATVAVTRVVLQAHWPLDTIGGAALGLALVAAAVWWHEGHPYRAGALTGAWPAFLAWLDKRKEIVPIPFYAVLFLMPPFVGEDSPLDLVFDVAGAVVVAAGVLLRLWAVKEPGLLRGPDGGTAGLVTTGPYAYVRHPMYVANALIGIGVGLLAESAAALVVIPAVMCVVFRLVVPLEEARLLDRFGEAYTNYCARVPRWMPNDLRPKGRSSPQSVWTALRLDLRFALASALLALIAQLSESGPHLLR